MWKEGFHVEIYLRIYKFCLWHHNIYYLYYCL